MKQIHVIVHINLHTCTYMYVHVHTLYATLYIHMCICTCIYIYVYAHVHVLDQISEYDYTCMCVRVHVFLTCTLYNQETFAELQIPFQVVNAARRIPVVEYTLNKALSPFTSDRQGLLTKCTPIDLEMAKKLLDHGYKQLSKFKRWCPVEVRM